MIEPVSRNIHQKLFRAVLQAVLGDEPFRNSMLVKDSFELMYDTAVLELMFISFRIIGNLP